MCLNPETTVWNDLRSGDVLVPMPDSNWERDYDCIMIVGRLASGFKYIATKDCIVIAPQEIEWGVVIEDRLMASDGWHVLRA